MKKIAVAALLAALIPAAISFPAMANGENEATAAQATTNPAANVVATQDPAQTIKSTLQARLGVPVDEVKPSEINGLYQVVIGKEVIYSDPAARYIVQGDIFEIPSGKNVTEAVRTDLLKIDFDKDLPFADAIKTVYGDGSRRIAVFSDPNCSFCKRFENTLKDLKDVTIYTFLYPVITPGSEEQAANIWCSKDQAATWKAQMVDGKAAPKRDKSCDTSVLKRNVALGHKLKVTGTPAIFFEDGRRAPGAVDLEYLEQNMPKPKAK